MIWNFKQLPARREPRQVFKHKRRCLGGPKTTGSRILRCLAPYYLYHMHTIIQGGFFNWSAWFSVPKWKKLAQPTRSFFTLKISWKTSPGWLQLVFHFGTENRADQLKKPPCIIIITLTSKDAALLLQRLTPVHGHHQLLLNRRVFDLWVFHSLHFSLISIYNSIYHCHSLSTLIISSS